MFLQYSLPSPSLCSTLLDQNTAFNYSTFTCKADIASQNRSIEGVRMCGREERDGVPVVYGVCWGGGWGVCLG